MTRKNLSYRLRAALLAPLLLVVLIGSFFAFSQRPAQALGFSCCGLCFAFDCAGAAAVIIGIHSLGESLLEDFIENEFEEQRDWLTGTFFRGELGHAMAHFTEQMSGIAMQQLMITGAFLDAKHQLETQRLFQQLKAQAHKDYQPSEDFCWFGTNARSLAASETRTRFNSLALSGRAMSRHLGAVGMSGSVTEDEDMFGRWNRFVANNCDPRDNNWQGGDSGLEQACGGLVFADRNRVNRDIDYTRLIDEPRTLSVDFTNTPLSGNGEEEDVLAMANYLYGHKVLTRSVSGAILRNKQAQQFYLWLRSVAAKRSVAENSFNAIVGLKTSGTSDLPGAPVPPQTREYMAAILNELGVADEDGDGDNADEIYAYIGDRPSYYAQLEILSKKIYQNPDFYAYLYDKPANVERKAVAIRAVDLMIGRAMFESQLRREMILSVLLETRLRKPFRDTNQEMMSLLNN